MSNEKCIELKNINKSYNNILALKNINLKFEKGKIYGLLGRNGAGKSTMLNIISNRIFADSGEVFIDGEISTENDKALSKLYLMSELTLYPLTMKIKDIFKWSGEFYESFDLEYAMKTADEFELNINKKVQALSTGYASIFKNIVALSVNTPYVLLDEPVLGLDANYRDKFYKLLLQKYTENQFTAIISTHLIEEISGFVEDIIIINKGEIIKNQSRDELLSEGYTITGAVFAVDEYIKGKNILGTDVIGGIKSAYIQGAPEGTLPENLEISPLDLQKLFIELTNDK